MLCQHYALRYGGMCTYNYITNNEIGLIYEMKKKRGKKYLIRQEWVLQLSISLFSYFQIKIVSRLRLCH